MSKVLSVASTPEKLAPSGSLAPHGLGEAGGAVRANPMTGGGPKICSDLTPETSSSNTGWTTRSRSTRSLLWVTAERSIAG